ncbi:nitrate reductase molybdenum cofactor assembly chaperone [Anoxybacillus kestanbolensis]|uniref:nitrate reductase molybdenum cofactor assembly chaperone n=1 Tax=Anoxybacillus kestanbolensis TaxID=227476 RepID=UPI00208DA4BB|nr:nitrate reductase molybdenum cofactor assembly chaperone [Anoxybacillus kestanbolensis]MCL9969201.1 nitrate reductase molybdenum cofactor assembly chaperone [Anoxybacillus kestanbolensis]
MREYQKIFMLASCFLQYPEEWELAAIEQEVSSLCHDTVRKLFLQFLDYVKTTALNERCEVYVRTFDFSEQTTLYLTYHALGDEKERGQLFIQLKEQFRQAGFPLVEEELPDYLPLVLEFAAIAPMEAAQKMLSFHKQSIDKLAEQLKNTDHPYYAVVGGCVLAIDSFLQEKKAS